MKLNVPVPDGVPDIWPVEAVKVRPPGKAPDAMLQLTGEVPPEDASVELKARFMSPPGRDAVVTASTAVCVGLVVQPQRRAAAEKTQIRRVQ